MPEEGERTILIVDDEEMVRDLLTQTLCAEHNCITAATVQEAMMFLSNGFFDVVITDIGMPGDSGFRLCDFIRKHHPETVIIVISGDIDSDEIALHGAFDCIEKPFDLTQVQMTIKRAFSYRRLRRNLACASTHG